MIENARRVTVARGVAELRRGIAAWRSAGGRVGLVPTMGALHEGHLALVRAARAGCEWVAVTIFVNPAQFGAGEDLDAYPQREAEDRAALAALGVDLIFAPAAAEMYGPGFATTVTVAGLTDGLCGAFRPGHFEGVTTVVAKLLLQSLPDAAYFGEKDYQQLLVIRRMVRDLDIPVAIEAVPTVREPDGLALSSRNERLAPGDRETAPKLHKVLKAVAGSVAEGISVAESVAWGLSELEKAGFAPIDYLELRDAETLAPIDRLERRARAFVAAHLGDVRLIDNLPVGRAPKTL